MLLLGASRGFATADATHHPNNMQGLLFSRQLSKRFANYRIVIISKPQLHLFCRVSILYACCSSHGVLGQKLPCMIEHHVSAIIEHLPVPIN